jgi:hypothetical protein
LRWWREGLLQFCFFQKQKRRRARAETHKKIMGGDFRRLTTHRV